MGSGSTHGHTGQSAVRPFQIGPGVRRVMKRRGCLDCHLIEPRPGQWIGRRCPRCAEEFAKKNQPAGDKPSRDPDLAATVSRLKTYLTNIAIQYPDLWKEVDRLRAERGRSEERRVGKE